uniref:Nectin cell adhesion molecule 4a n=1 Tax=Seriola dumerili TaxID=41447 RepID=A0A3B4V2R5_SERDU
MDLPSCPSPLSVTVIHGEFMGLPPNGSLRSLAEEETVLPCRYQPSESGVVVVQVTWYKETEQIITAHHINGQTAFGTWSRRVRFRSSEPTVDSSLVIMSTDISDEGKYICRISTFPSGNFDSEMSLIVWTVPISSIDPVILVEGQSYRQAASCRSIGRPPPRLTWDTDLNGQFTSRSSDNGAVSTQYSLHPLRSMNGKKLDCLVWHETSSTPRRLSNRLVVHFPPHAEVSGYNEDWSIGMENAALRCLSGGNPKPQSFTWIRKGGQLPEGVIAHPNGTLAFGRPLNSTDKGIYECEAKNEVGVGKAEHCRHDRLRLVIIITHRYIHPSHPRKNLKLEKELTERKYSSQLNPSFCFFDLQTEENIPLRVEGTLRTSLSSLGVSLRGGAFDYLGRPVLHNNSRRGRERLLDRDEDTRLRVETYVRNSTMSLVSQETRFHPPLTPSAFPMVQSTEVVRQLNGSASIPTDGGSRPGSVAKNHQHPPMSCNYPPVTDDEDEVDEGLGGPASQEHPDDQYSETNSSQVSEAHSTRYQQTNGTLRPKPRPSPTMISPHASLIHKAQIV